jgi:hypothetical protein
MVIYIKSRSRRSTSVGRRDTEALNALDRLRLRLITSNIEWLCSIIPIVSSDETMRNFVAQTIISEYTEALRILVVDIPDRPPRMHYLPMTFASMEDHLILYGVSVSERFRFQSFEAMRRLIICFRLPQGYISLNHRYKSTAEEIVLISLSRFSFPLRWSDLYERFPGRKSWFLREAFYYFINFMTSNWGYLLVNNLEWWKPKFGESCEAIRRKLQNLNHENWRQYHQPARLSNLNGQLISEGFRVAYFIDDTMMAFSRPGGNMDEGPAAPRVPQDIQEAWYNGWKKLHGMKWQTVILANGMDLHVFGPLSVRRNDLTSLDKSDIEQKLRNMFAYGDIKYIIFGDSAFMVSDMMATSESYPGRGMSSVREIIEWSYKDVKQLWKYCDYKHVLQLRKQPVGKIFFVCLLLRNAYVTLHGSQAGDYFTMLPPTLEEWTSQGVQAHPIPQNYIFSENYNVAYGEEFDYDDENSDSEDDD